MKEELTKKFKMLDMNDVDISTEDKTIIGTQALAPCIAFVLYQREHKRAIAGHLSSNCFLTNGSVDLMISRLESLIKENGLENLGFDLYLIEGAYRSQQKVYASDVSILRNPYKYEFTLLEALEYIFKQNPLFKINSVNDLASSDYQIVDEQGNPSNSETALLSKRFAFDTVSGKFVTDQVAFGAEYIVINNDFKRR